jgi:hypothetical protein
VVIGQNRSVLTDYYARTDSALNLRTLPAIRLLREIFKEFPKLRVIAEWKLLRGCFCFAFRPYHYHGGRSFPDDIRVRSSHTVNYDGCRRRLRLRLYLNRRILSAEQIRFTA